MASLRNQFYFTLFYATAVVFSFMNSTVYWFITRQNDAGEPEEPPPLDLASTSALPALPDTPCKCPSVQFPSLSHENMQQLISWDTSQRFIRRGLVQGVCSHQSLWRHVSHHDD